MARVLTGILPRARTFAATAAALLWLSGCTPGSAGDPGGSLTLTGTVSDQGGNTVEGVSVTAHPALAPQDIESSRHTELAALGFACIDERPPSACRKARETGSTDQRGQFSLSLGVHEVVTRRSDIGATLVRVGVTARAEPAMGELSGPAVARWIDVEDPASEVDVGDVVVWAPILELVPGEGGDAVLRWQGDPPGRGARYEVLVEDSEGELVWKETTHSRELGLKLVNLADTRGAVSVVAIGVDLPERWRSARLPYRADEGAVRAATAREVEWPREVSLAPELVLAAIISLLFASMLFVVTAGTRHRRRLTVMPLPPR